MLTALKRNPLYVNIKVTHKKIHPLELINNLQLNKKDANNDIC